MDISKLHLSGFNEQVSDYIMTTLTLMNELHFKVRDTFLHDRNMDDFYSNGNKYNGPRLFDIKWVENTKSGYAEVNSNRAYVIANYSSLAYDKYVIYMPKKFKNQSREDPIIHECVHFLQQSSPKDEENYIDYNGKNYHEYISQRTEVEAHLVQILYILRFDLRRIEKCLSEENKNIIDGLIKNFINTYEKTIGIWIIHLCKQQNLI